MGIFNNWLKRITGKGMGPDKAVDLLRDREVWEPSYPEAARKTQEGTFLEGTVSIEPREESGTGWVDAPSTSHIQMMHFVYGGKPTDRMEPGKPNQSKFVRLFLKNESIITVRFRDDANGADAEYAYFFTDHALALSVWEDLITSPHPYGEVLYPRVIKARIPYKPNWRK